MEKSRENGMRGYRIQLMVIAVESGVTESYLHVEYFHISYQKIEHYDKVYALFLMTETRQTL